MNRRVAILLGLLGVCFVVIRMCAGGSTFEELSGSVEVAQHTRVVLTPLALTYYEDDHELEFHVETGTDRRGPFSYVFVLSPTRWKREMPEWSRNRREAIIAEIERLTKGRYRLKWIEMR